MKIEEREVTVVDENDLFYSHVIRNRITRDSIKNRDIINKAGILLFVPTDQGKKDIPHLKEYSLGVLFKYRW